MIERADGPADRFDAAKAAGTLPVVSIPYGRQSLDKRDVEAVEQVLQGDWLTQGPTVGAFEEAFAAVCDVPHAVAFSSGTAALHGAAFAAGLEPGEELVTSAITFAASANCAAYIGATPRFADIERDTWNVSADTIAPAVGEQTKVVVPVHFAGLPAPVAEIRAALPEGVRIVEDASHALGADVGGVPVGSCRDSDMAVFSFHPVKSIAAGEGGMVTTRDPDLAERMRSFRNHGFVRERELLVDGTGDGWYHEQQSLGFNYRLSDIHSALGLSQLEKLERFISRRNEVAERYRRELAGVDAIELPPGAPDDARHAYHLFVIRHREGEAARRRLYDGLRERGILAQVHYIPVYWHPYYRRQYGYERGLCPEAERFYAGCLSIPCYPTLSADDQSKVIAAVEELA